MSYRVVPYDFDSFRVLLSELSKARADQVDYKLSSGYFKGYFDAVDVQTLVVEEHYVDHDYLEDFAAYYVRCFNGYDRLCARLHFFQCQFGAQDLDEYLGNGSSSPLGRELKQGYVGFMVVRPLPASIVGKTCLAHYGSDGGRRHFPTVSRHTAHLFGLPLSVNTVPFQEQDKVTAACATSALWSAFQVTGRLFQHSTPSPVEITRSATQHMPLRTRAFPTDGLTLEQMAHAIRGVGLEPYHVAGERELPVKAAAYAYLSAGIPALLCFELLESTAQSTHSRGHHAVVITGYSAPKSSRPRDEIPSAFSFSSVDKFYVHDDQVGPYARMEFSTPGHGSGWYLSTSWGLQGSNTVSAHPIALLLPLYNKIRIPYNLPLSDSLAFALGLEVMGRAVERVRGLDWDFRLTTLNQFRAEVLSTIGLEPARKRRLLTMPLPRFIWRTTAFRDSIRLVDILFDATDVADGRYVRHIEIGDPVVEALLNYVRSQSPANTSGVSRHLNQVYSKLSVAS